MSATARGIAADEGDTLIEILVAVVIMGVAVTAIITGLLTSVTISDLHRKQATAGVYVRDYGEAIENAVDNTGNLSCATTAASYGGAAVPGFDPTNYQKSVVAGSLRYWDGSAWQTSCGSDTGVQQLKVQVNSSDNRATETLILVVRKPCGPGSSCT